MAKYKNRRGEVADAFEFCEDFMAVGANCHGVPDWGITAYDEEHIYFEATGECYIETKRGKRHVAVGDYIIRRENGDLNFSLGKNFNKLVNIISDELLQH